MKVGLVLGKFYPLHKGHLGLIRFASSHCDLLYVLVCASDKEEISGTIRLSWIKEALENEFFEDNQVMPEVVPILLNYSEQDLPNTSVSSKKVANIWASKIKALLDRIDVVFTSEKYGDYLAKYLKCRHIMFDALREKFPVSASGIRKDPFSHWDYIVSTARSYFVKKVAILGTESTGKSTLAQSLAAHFKTSFVSEVGRQVVPQTEVCTIENLYEIAVSHAENIQQKTKDANKIIIVDTDLTITRSYAHFLFEHELKVEAWVEQNNHFDLYLYLEADAPFIQDGTRLNEAERNLLDQSHKMMLDKYNIGYESISGSWKVRFQKAVELIERKFEIIKKPTRIE